MIVSVGRNEKIWQGLAKFYRFKQMPFEMRRYRRIDSPLFMPQEKEVDELISACGKKTATDHSLIIVTPVFLSS